MSNTVSVVVLLRRGGMNDIADFIEEACRLANMQVEGMTKDFWGIKPLPTVEDWCALLQRVEADPAALKPQRGET